MIRPSTLDARDACVIGAGGCGLAAAKALHDRGLVFDCFERGSAVGGLWRYENDNGMSAIYKSLQINTSRDMTAFADFPMPASRWSLAAVRASWKRPTGVPSMARVFPSA